VIQDETQISIISIPKVSSKLSLAEVLIYCFRVYLYREISVNVNI